MLPPRQPEPRANSSRSTTDPPLLPLDAFRNLARRIPRLRNFGSVNSVVTAVREGQARQRGLGGARAANGKRKQCLLSPSVAGRADRGLGRTFRPCGPPRLHGG